jgi:FkbM family methyltransferase
MKEALKMLARLAGFEVRQYSVTSSPDAQLKTILSHHRVNLVFDVGANVGGYGRKLRACGYKGRIVSFEPLQTAHRVLTQTAHNDSRWEVAPRMAIGAEDGAISINIAANFASSSVLPMAEAHVAAAPDSRYIRSEEVPLRRLDTIAPNYIRDGSIAFLKADTQGYEDRVLTGARETLNRVVGLQLEMSFAYNYTGQVLFSEMVERYIPKDFTLWAIWPEFANQRTGQLLAVDAIFMR